LIGVVLSDPREKEITKSGLIKFKDAETGILRYIDTNNNDLRNRYRHILEIQNANRKSTFIKSRLDSIEVNTNESYVKPLANFFRKREKML